MIAQQHIKQSKPASLPPESVATDEGLPRGAEILVEALVQEGVDSIFGYPGGAVLHIYDELWRRRERVTHYLVRHEQGAVHMAEGYARASGRVGVALVTSGPGATNAVTGIANAYMDSTPIVVITGQVPLHLIGTDAFQEVDTVGITRPCVKHNYLVRDVRDLAAVVHEAFFLARTGRPGPVVIDIPKDVSAARAPYSRLDHIVFPCRERRKSPDAQAVSSAADAIMRAERPVLYVGGGIVNSGADRALLAFAEALQLPVTPTLMGLGGFPSAHALSLGMLGMHGTYAANMAVAESDLLVAVGVRFDDRVTGRLSDFATGARFIHIDIDPAEIGKNKPAHVPIVGDAKEALRALDAQTPPPDCEPWHRQIAEWKARYPLRYRQTGDTIKPQFAIEQVYRLTDGRAIVVTDVGQHQMWAAQFYLSTEPRTWLTSGGLGAMGFGFPAALGAQIGRPDALVCALLGDGGFQMTLQDLGTAVEWGLPLKLYVLDNGSLGMVRQWQQLFYRERYSHVFLKNPDFAKLAEAYGAVGINVRRVDELEPAVRRSLEVTDRPCVVAITVDPEENCYPMIPSGQSVKEMIVEDDRIRD